MNVDNHLAARFWATNGNFHLDKIMNPARRLPKPILKILYTPSAALLGLFFVVGVFSTASTAFVQSAFAQSSTKKTMAQDQKTGLPAEGISEGTNNSIGGSTNPSEGTDQAEGANQATDRPPTYFEIVMAVRKNETEINRLFASIPIGFPNKQKAHLDKIEQLKVANEKLKSMLGMAALEAYQTDPEKNVRAGQLIYRQMLAKMDPGISGAHFDPSGALEIANILIKGGLNNGEIPGSVQLKDVAYQAFRASYAIEDFGRAELMLKKIAEQKVRIKPEITQELEKTRERWQRELKIRRLEGITDDLPKVKFETTEGTFLVELFENHAPQTVGNFISLVEKKFYNDMPFFLVKPGEFSQTGCPNGDGSGDSGYLIPCECYREQIRHHFTGTLSMANRGRRDTGGSQFFISHQPNDYWDGRYTAFGRVKEGMDVVYRLTTVDKTQPDPNEVTPSKILTATVVWARDHEYVPTRIKKEAETNSSESNDDFLNRLEEAAKSGQ